MSASAVVAVVGAGNVGCALAADLSLRGVEVRLCTRSESRLGPIRDAGAITVTGEVTGQAPVAMLTTVLDEAVEGADVVAITVPTSALPHYAPMLIEATTPEQLLWLDPGHSGGALYLRAEMRRADPSRVARICQLSTASHGSRMTGPSAVGVFRLAPAAMAAFPATALEECHEQLDALLPGQFGQADSVLELDLMNINPVMHPAQMVCNAGWIEATGGDFPVYREGSGPSVARIMESVDAERLAVADRLAVPASPFANLVHDLGFTTAEAAATGRVYDSLQAAEPVRAVLAPPTLDHRYLHEDVGWGLVPWMAYAHVGDVATPTMEALTHVAGVINSTDYRRAGLSVDEMGVAGMHVEQLVEYVSTGRAV